MAQVATAYVEVRPDLGGFASELKAKLARVHASKEVDVKPDLSGFDKAVSARIRTMRVPKIRPKVEVDVDKRYSKKLFNSLAGGLKGFGDKFNYGIVGRVFGGVFKTISSLMTSVAEQSGKLFEGLGAQLVQLGGKFGEFGGTLSSMGASLIKFGGPVSEIVGAIVGLGSAIFVSVAILGALQVALGAVLAVVIPLVAAVTALVAEFIALGGAISASLLALPGAIAIGVAAFGPLIAVMEKFQALFEKSADAVGPLYEGMERLKNAIFAVISNDFVKTFQRFATTVLPQVFVGIEAVAQAWNKLLLGLFKMASVPSFIEGVNAALQMGARLVGLMAEGMQKLGPAMMAFAVAALPALSSMMDDVADLVTFFSNWFNQMARGQGAVQLFAQVAIFVRQALGLMKQFAPLAGVVIQAVMGPATRFLTIIGQMADAMTAMFSTTSGQAALRGFFTSMNTVVALLAQLFVEDVIPAVLQFGTVIKDAMVAAKPLLGAFIGMLMNLLTRAMPGIITFMDQMTRAITDPGVQVALGELADSISELMAVAADTNAVLTFVQALSLIVDVATSIIFVINKLAVVAGVLGTAFKAATGNVKGAMTDMAAVVASKANSVGTKSQALGTTWQNMSKTGVAAFDNILSASTTLANAPSWQAIIDNSTAAAQAINAMGYTAYQSKNETDIQTYEKTLTRIHNANKKVVKVGKPKIDVSGISSAWTSGWNTAVDTGLKKTSTSKKISKYVSNLKPTLKALNVMDFVKAPRAYDTGREIARYLAKGITSGTKNVNRATDIIYKANKTKLNQLATVVKDYATDTKKYAAAIPDYATKLKKITTVSGLNTYLEGWKQHWQNMLNEIVEFKNNVRQALTPNRNLVGIFGYFPTPKEVAVRLKMIYDQTKRFTDGIAALQKAGLDPQLAREWLMAGVEGAGNMVAGLQGATKAEIDAINAQYRGIGTLANTVAEQQAIAWKGVGEETVKGYIKGIQEMQTEVTKTMTKMLTDALAAAKKALKIKSPSQVFAGIGNDTMAGYIVGINDMASATLGTVSDVFTAVGEVPPPTITPQVKPALAHTGTLGQMAAAEPHVDVKVYIGDRELTDMVRVVLENADSTRARALYAGRRGG